MSETGTERLALVVRGGWEGHQPVETTELFLPFLRAQGFEVVAHDSSAVYEDTELLARADLIVQCMSMGEISREAVQGLRAAVAAGSGLAGWHGGIVDAYPSNEYLQLVGGRFVAHPSDPGPDGPTPQRRHRIVMTERGRAHPITTGIDDFELVTEQYWVLHDDLSDLLATTTHPARADDPWHRPVVSPAVWTRRWGRGRIFVATPGHDVATLQNPSVRTIVERGMLWAARDSESEGE